MNRLLRIASVLGAVLALSACVVAPGYGYGPRYGGGGYRTYAYSQPLYGFQRGGGYGGGWGGHGGGYRGGWGGYGGGHRGGWGGHGGGHRGGWR